MRNRKINTILIGLGRIATRLEADPFRNKPCTHAGVLFSSWGKSRFSFNAAFEKEISRREEFQKQWSLPSRIFFSEKDLSVTSLTSSEKQLLASQDLAIIATPSSSHFPLAKELISLGIPHLLIEKPVSLEAKEAKILKRLSDKKGTKIWINHERRYHPQYQFVRDHLQRKQWGEVKSVRASVFTSAKNPGLAFSSLGGGPLLHDGTHALDLIHWLFGKPKLNYAKVIFPKLGTIEDRATAWFSLPSGGEILLDVSGGRKYFQFELDILTEEYRVVLSNDGFQFFRAQPSKLYSGFHSLVPILPKRFPKKEKSNAFLGIYREIYEVISGKKKSQEAYIGDNIEILESIESIYQFRRK
ncbi:Gfo/Idh/MocA family protein [Leptospira idonii]|uniref:Gfo/Idh/MocA family oxidoreductase n=1 Tax=Leptospira idonii TaxID=1193500 RepID=A0A4V3JXU4_9LEPT|nr:Gfo/Idh/MocA family oxidoreductase [Leptospira idonii]TGN18606.1 gfo/Idh/MocA family oxidoreductase [Leptospira idonii]